jgi:hypothetical protein
MLVHVLDVALVVWRTDDRSHYAKHSLRGHEKARPPLATGRWPLPAGRRVPGT